MKLKTLFFFTFLSLSSEVFSQDSIPKKSIERGFWITYGLGTSRAPDIGFSVGGSFNLNRNKHIFTFQMIGSGDVLFQKDTRYGDYSLLYGRLIKLGNTALIISTGLGVVENVRNDGLWYSGIGIVPAVHLITIGLPIKIQYFARPKRGFGFSIEGFTNINNQQFIIGALGVFRFGSVQKRE